MGFVSDTKDRLAELAALAWLNASLLRPCGRATRLHINSSAKQVELELELKGENQPVEILISEYKIGSDHGRINATIERIRTSREWLTTLAEKHVAGRTFTIPAPLGPLLLKFFGAHD